MRFYGFDAEEILDDTAPDLEADLDPKTTWALRHRAFYPVEVNTADYETLLRVPGIGQISARRIVAARRTHSLAAEDLRKMGVVMKRAQYFVTAQGRYCGQVRIESPYLRDVLVEQTPMEQLSLFSGSVPALPKGVMLSDSTMSALAPYAG
jgi:predicted DNA-binding helix-hairpin-helix protein